MHDVSLSSSRVDSDYFHSYYHYYYYNYYARGSDCQTAVKTSPYSSLKNEYSNLLLAAENKSAIHEQQLYSSQIPGGRQDLRQITSASSPSSVSGSMEKFSVSVGDTVDQTTCLISSGLMRPEAAAAYALVRAARLTLVILIGILVIKLILLRKSDKKIFKSDKNIKMISRKRNLNDGNQGKWDRDNICNADGSSFDRTYLSTLELPPGPIGLPFLGYLPFMSHEIHVTLTRLSERYGPIYQIHLGGIRVVVLNDASLVRQAFRQPVFSGRPDTQLTRILQGYGIVNSDGALWKEQRAFLHSALRKLGAKSLMNGSNGLEAKIQNQVREFVNDLSEHAVLGKSCQVRPIVARAVSSVVGSIVMNLTYRKEKEKFDRLIELMQEGFRLFAIAMPLDFIPIFRFLPGVSYAYKKIKKNRTETSAFFKGFADEHRKYLSENFNLGISTSTSQLHPRRNWTSANATPNTSTTTTTTNTTTATTATAASCQGMETIPTSTHADTASPILNATKTAINLEQLVSISDADDTNGGIATTASDKLIRQVSEQKSIIDEEKTAADIKKHVELDQIVARDLVDAYIIQQKRHENDGKENYFSDKQLVQIMSDIFSAGLETVTSTIEWSILFMILNPDCQQQVQDEIDQVIGRDRLPQLDDLAKMPYTEATIYEVLRRSNVVALGNAHAALDDASIGGYLIPKGTQILPNLYGINMNAKLWDEPTKFDPNRFIINNKAQKPDFFIPFSVGRRVCLGDLLAKMEVFLFLVGLLQKFDLSVAHEDREFPPKVEGTIGLSNAPVAFRVALQSRSPEFTCNIPQ